MSTATDLALGQGCEPALDLIKPRGRGRSEMHMEARIASKPAFDGRSLVGTVVVHHQMHLKFLRHRLFNRAQKLQELLRAVPSMQLPDDFAGSDVQGCKQCRGTVAAVIMRS